MSRLPVRFCLAASLLTWVAICPGGSGQALAATGQDLRDAFDQLLVSRLDTMSTGNLSGFTLTHEDLELVLDSGRIAFLAPIQIDGEEKTFGALFQGQAQFRFRPGLSIERQQLQRHLGSDSLDFRGVSAVFR